METSNFMPMEEFFGPLLAQLVQGIAEAHPERDKAIGSGSLTLARRIVVKKHPEGCVYFHQWKNSDPDELHDHPSDNCSLVLTEGFWEVCREPGLSNYVDIEGGGYERTWKEVRYWRPPGSVVFRKATDRHRIELKPGTMPWTLLLTGKEVREWGFWPDGKFVVGREYRNVEKYRSEWDAK